MTNENKFIMELLKAYILNKPLNFTQCDVNWDDILITSSRQALLPILYDKIAELSTEYQPNSTIMNLLHQSAMDQIFFCSKSITQLESVLNKASSNGIKVVCLKGCVTRELYPVPEMRTMGDFDIYIQQKDMDEILKIFEGYGYNASGKKSKEMVFDKEGALEWEVACTMESEFKNTYATADMDYLNKSIPWKYNQYIPNHTLLLQHIIVHTAKHLLRNGAGVRNLCDIALCMMNYHDIDYSSIRNICVLEECVKVYDTLMNCVRKWFDVDISETGAAIIDNDQVDNVVEYMLSDTVFGIRCGNNRLINWTLRQDDNISPVRKIFFPSLKLMSAPYPYLKKYPWLLPIAWLQRGFNAIITQKIPVKSLVNGIDESIEYSKKHEIYMKQLGLK